MKDKHSEERNRQRMLADVHKRFSDIKKSTGLSRVWAGDDDFLTDLTDKELEVLYSALKTVNESMMPTTKAEPNIIPEGWKKHAHILMARFGVGAELHRPDAAEYQVLPDLLVVVVVLNKIYLSDDGFKYIDSDGTKNFLGNSQYVNLLMRECGLDAPRLDNPCVGDYISGDFGPNMLIKSVEEFLPVENKGDALFYAIRAEPQMAQRKSG